MRLVRVTDLQEGMELGKTLYSPTGMVLLKKGIILKPNFIESIKQLDLPSIYIEDDFSHDVEIVDMVTDEVRMAATQQVKAFFVAAADNAGSKLQYATVSALNDLVSRLVDQILEAKPLISNLIDLKLYDDATFAHSVNVSAMSTVLGVEFGLGVAQLNNLAKGALFHDIGKIFIDKNILNKDGPLTAEESRIMKTHPKLGHDFAKEVLNLPYDSMVCILHHHERYNGEGYPFGKTGEELHLNAQIVAIADVYDALTSYRPYRTPILPSEAMEYILGNVDRYFSKKIVDAFKKKIAVYPAGQTVELSNGRKGVVFENFEGYIFRPLVKLYNDSNMEEFFDLRDSSNANITILKSLT